MISYKFRIYPSKKIQQKLNEHISLCRWLYNRLLEELNKAKKDNKKLSWLDTQHLIIKLKEENPKLKEVYARTLLMVNHQLWNNIKSLSQLKKKGKKIGRLRYKGKWFKTINYNQHGFKLERKKLVLSKIGSIQIKITREIEGKIKGVIIKRENSGRWHAILQVENKPEQLPTTNKTVGIDLGIKHFLTDSDGRQVENPKFYGKTLQRIKIEQRKLSKKKKGSKNREKQRIKLAKVYEKLTSQRNDFLHKLSRFYINNYDFIAVENLNIRNMTRNHNLAQKILDASWGKFLQMLSYKAENAGRKLVKVNPRGTSEGLSYEDPLRDWISACRILQAGLGRPGGPVEMRPLQELVRVPASHVVEAGS